MSDDPEAIEVPTSDLDTIAILLRSIERHEAMRHRSSAYGRTSLEMQDTGLLGEKAVTHWLSQHHPHVEELGDNPTQIKHAAGDVAVVRSKQFGGLTARHLITFEVKTNRQSDWKRYGRTLDTAQLARTKADAYVWCVVSDTWPTNVVRIMGWLPTIEVKDPAAGERTVEHGRPHVRITRPMRDMRSLPAWWETIPTPWS